MTPGDAVSSFPDLGKSPAYQLWRAGNAWQRVARKALEPIGLTHVQYILLGAVDVLGRAHGCVTQADIARFADFDENMTSQVIRCLADRDLLHREKHPDDARAMSIRLTDEGQTMLREGRRLVKPMVATFFAPLAEDHDAFVARLRLLADVAEVSERGSLG